VICMIRALAVSMRPCFARETDGGRDMMRRRVACGEPLKSPNAIFKSSWCSPVARSSFGGCTRFTCSRKAKL
jgi:hypothetical protein